MVVHLMMNFHGMDLRYAWVPSSLLNLGACIFSSIYNSCILKNFKFYTWIFSSLKNLLVSTLENKKWMLVVVLVAAVVIPSWFCGCVGCCHE